MTTHQIPASPSRQGLLPALLDSVRQFRLRQVRGLIGFQRQRLSLVSSRFQQADAGLRALQHQIDGQLGITSTDTTTSSEGTSTVPMATVPTTVAGTPPQAATGLATQVGSSGATLQGTVNPQGQATTYHFSYGPTTAYGSTIPVPDGPVSGTTAQAVQQALTGLNPATTYHFQLVATNPQGVTLGADETFTTAAAPPPGAPLAATGLAVAVGSTGATLQGTVNPQGQATTYDFNYGPTTAYGSVVPSPEASAGSGSDSQQVQQALTGLTPGTTYHVQIVAKNASGTVTGADETFTTAAAPAVTPPQVATGLAAQVAATGATLQATVNPEGQPTTYHFNYGPTTAYGSTAPVPDAQAGSGTAPQQVLQAIAGLTPSTTYHCQVVATSAGGTSAGADETFTTPAAAPVAQPQVATGLASGISETGATLQATVNPQGQATTYHFNYGPTTAYGSVLPSPDASAGSGNTGQPVQQALTGLTPGTTYHCQVVATSAGGTSAGADETFTTPAAAPVAQPQVATGLASGISETGATLQATVNPQGQATTYHFNYGPTTAYGSVLPSPDASAGSGNTGQPVQQALTGLTPGTEYHFQIAASSAGGTSYGADETFATPATASNPEAADEVLPEHVERTLFEIYDGIRERDLTQSGYPLASYAAEMLEAEGHDKISVSAMHASFDRWLHRRFRQHRIRIAMLEPKEEAEDEELLTEVERAAERRRVPHELLFEIFENLPEEAFTKDDPRYPLVNPVRERTPTGYLRPTRDEIRAAYQVWLQRIAE